MKKLIFALLIFLAPVICVGCGLAIFDNATRKFDSAVGYKIAEKMGDTIDTIVSGGDDVYGDEKGVTIRVLTPTPTDDPFFVPTATPFIIATPTPLSDEPAGKTVDEWVYATEAANVRSGWSTEYLISGALTEHDCVHRVAILSNGWSKISYNGNYAYVYGEYLTTEKPRRVGTTHLDVMEYTLDAARSGEDVYVLDVKNIMQKPELINGPEITCLAIVLKYLGYDKVNKVALAEEFLKTAKPGEATPFEAYIGDPKTSVNSYGCYASVIVEAANAWFKDKNIQKKCLEVSGATMDELLKYVKSGVPVICWTTVSLSPTTYGDSWDINGQNYTWRNNEHCVVITGYNNTRGTIIVCDPLKGLVEYDKADFFVRYKEQYSNACIITNKIQQ
ncbi:MAG: C39 family peptidase [Lachnospiraceae bacterium]|nr:C39 family peptidase [Lachnospiraceae bacterium]